MFKVFDVLCLWFIQRLVLHPKPRPNSNPAITTTAQLNCKSKHIPKKVPVADKLTPFQWSRYFWSVWEPVILINVFGSKCWFRFLFDWFRVVLIVTRVDLNLLEGRWRKWLLGGLRPAHFWTCYTEDATWATFVWMALADDTLFGQHQVCRSTWLV